MESLEPVNRKDYLHIREFIVGCYFLLLSKIIKMPIKLPKQILYYLGRKTNNLNGNININLNDNIEDNNIQINKEQEKSIIKLFHYKKEDSTGIVKMKQSHQFPNLTI